MKEKTNWTTNKLIEHIKSINPNIEILGEYISTTKHIDCRCKICGNSWNPVAGSLLRGSGCPVCAYNKNGQRRKTTHEIFVLNLSKINPTIKVLGTYDGAYKKIECKCTNCGHIWSAVPHYILSGSGCPQCSHSATSFIEQFILKSFQKVLGEKNVLSRNKSIIGKEIDIIIPKLHLAFEPGAWTYHKKNQKKDIEKKSLCDEKGIRLITIYYGCKEFLENKNDVIIYNHNFELENQFEDLKNLIYTLFGIANIKQKFSENDWLKLKTDAYLSSRKITTKDFTSKLKNINSDITILGEYNSSSERIKCQCNICGHIWDPVANSLVQKRGCPKCKNKLNAERLTLTEEQFLEKLKVTNPNVKPLDKYIDSKTKINFQCAICNHEWSTIPNVILLGHGCPNCAGRPKITTAIFKEQMKSINPKIKIIGNYVNTDTKVACICKICNHAWSATPHQLKSGRGCPICGNKKKGSKSTNAIFIEKLNNKNPNIRPLEEYKGNKIKIRVSCLSCKHEWFVRPNNLLSGSGCPICAKNKRKK